VNSQLEYPAAVNPVMLSLLAIYDISGRLVETLINADLSSGYHSVRWDGSAQSSGIYFAKLTAYEYSENIKITLLK